MAIIEVRISKDGSKRLRLDGIDFEGPACDRVIKDLANRLGTISSETPKPEMFEDATIHVME
jgi:hypothetical protein